MKKKYTVAATLALTLAFTVPQAVSAEENGEDGKASVKGSLSVGASFNDDDDARTLSSEYSSMSDVDTRGIVGGSLYIHGDSSALGVEGIYLAPDEQEYEGHLNIDRVLDIQGGYQEFWHRTGQDNLLNMNAESNGPEQGALLWHTYEYAPDYGTNTANPDKAPEHEFGVSRKEFEATGKIRFPQVPGLTVGVEGRHERREGNEQVMTMSKCASCHVVAHDKDIDETTEDIKPFVQYNVGQLSLEYSYLNRKFKSSDPVMANYDEAANPLSGAGAGDDDFDNRIIYDLDDNPLAADRTPDTRKEVHSLKGKYDVSGYQNINAGYVYANMKNDDVGGASSATPDVSYDKSSLETDYNAGMFAWHNRFSKRLTVNLKGRYQNLESDDVFIDIARADGITGEEYDFTRESDEDRDIMTMKADLRYRLNRDITLRGGLEFEDEDRKNIHFLVNEDTTTYKGKAGMSWRLGRNLRLRADYRLTYVDDPYTWENSVYPNDGSLDDRDGVDLRDEDTPLTYTDFVYDQRSLNTSADPEMENDLKVKANYNLGSGMNLGGYARYTLGTNDEEINYDYEDEVVDSGLDFTFSPLQRMTASLGYNYYSHNTDSAFYIPVYHG
ncbi:MAG: GSU2204 family CXXCH-containing (seleno)protein [Desulfurivibrionaceae bacterium]